MSNVPISPLPLFRPNFGKHPKTNDERQYQSHAQKHANLNETRVWMASCSKTFLSSNCMFIGDRMLLLA
jgi:hypothetical protein